MRSKCPLSHSFLNKLCGSINHWPPFWIFFFSQFFFTLFFFSSLSLSALHRSSKHHFQNLSRGLLNWLSTTLFLQFYFSSSDPDSTLFLFLFANPNPLFRRFNNLLGTHSATMQQMPYYPPGYQAPSPYGSSHLMQADNGLPQLPHPVGVGEPNTASPGHGAKRKQVKNACSKFFDVSRWGLGYSRLDVLYSTLRSTSRPTSHHVHLSLLCLLLWWLTSWPCGLPNTKTMKKNCTRSVGTSAYAFTMLTAFKLRQP